MNGALELAEDLISRRSVTPEDGGCQELIARRLAPAGFRAEPLVTGGVTNLWLRRGTAAPLLCFAGHTDVVPTGPLAEWHSDPFVPTRRDGKLFGRGAADMKTSIACFVAAAEAFVQERPKHSGSIALLLTSDEEGPLNTDGTVKVVEMLKARGEKLAWCLVGEPSSAKVLGDMVRVGRRGSLSATLEVRGVQGHVAYPDQVRNPIHLVAPALAEIAATRWDEGNEFFPPSSFQVSNFNSGTGAANVVPGSAVILCNFRFSTASTEQSLRERFEGILKKHKLEYSISWVLGGKPFLSAKGKLIEAVQRAVKAHSNCDTELSTAGGTSDGRFIIDICPEIVELGPVNASIHKLNEHVDVSAFSTLTRIYLDILRALLP